MRLPALALVPLLALLTACSGGSSGEPAPPPTPTGAGPVMAELVGGFWRVTADGEPADSWVRFGAGSVDVFRPKGRLDGGFAAQGDRLLVGLYGWSTSLGDDHDAPWLTRADRVEPDGSGWRLLDATAAPIAHLRRDGRPAASTRYETDPTPPGTDASTLRDAVPGAGVVAVDPAAVEGAWHLADHREAMVRLGADGRWSNRTSCWSGTGANAASGAYRVLGDGMLLATGGPITLVGCSRPKHPSPDAGAITDLWKARSLLVQGDRLTLFDARGHRIGSLVR